MLSLKAKRVLEWILIVFVSIIALILGLILSYQQVYAGKIYKNVYFGTLDLSGMTRYEAAQKLQDKFDTVTKTDFEITAGNKTVKGKIGDTGLSFNSNQILDSIYNSGRSDNFWNNLTGASKTLLSKTVVNVSPTIDQAAYNNFVKITVDQLNSDPTDASLTISNGQVQFVTSSDGQVADTSKLQDQIVGLIDSTAKTITLDTTKKTANIKTANYQDAKNQAEAYLNKNITFTYNNQKYSPSKVQIGNWIRFTDTNNDGIYEATLDDSTVKAYINTFAKNIEVTKVDSKVDSDSGAVLQQGVEGVYINKDQALADLKSQLANTTVSVTLTVSKTEPNVIKISYSQGVELGRYSGKYIDVNLSTQQFCRVDGQTLIDCYTTSTGKPSTPTPLGSFAIDKKNPMGWAPNPGVWMPWFQEFKAGGYGIHELVVWPDGHHEPLSNIGLTVSHGCVRLAPGVAEMVYNWTEIGTPVYIHN